MKRILFNDEMVRALLAGNKTQTRRVVKPQPSIIADTSECPYKIGQRLWVAEAHTHHDDNFFAAEGGAHSTSKVSYRSDGEAIKVNSTSVYGSDTYTPDRWTPSVHMDRNDSRITLEVTDVRIERLMDISRGDAMAEGCPFPNLNGEEVGFTDPVKWYAFFNGIYQKKGFGTNPWVWVVEFKVLEGE